MEALDKNIKALLSVIRKTAEYREYKKQEEILSRNPELLERVDHFRAENYQLQSKASDNLFSVAEQLCRESEELRRYPEVNAFLDAELALCKLMQNICRQLVAGIDVHIPNL